MECEIWTMDMSSGKSFTLKIQYYQNYTFLCETMYILHIFNNNYCYAIQFEKFPIYQFDDVIRNYVTILSNIKHELLHLGL